jgi:hypothetical protein
VYELRGTFEPSRRRCFCSHQHRRPVVAPAILSAVDRWHHLGSKRHFRKLWSSHAFRCPSERAWNRPNQILPKSRPAESRTGKSNRAPSPR